MSRYAYSYCHQLLLDNDIDQSERTNSKQRFLRFLGVRGGEGYTNF